MSPQANTVYRGRSGQWAFIGHRVSGFLVFFFLLVHIVDVSLANNPRLYNEVHAVYGPQASEGLSNPSELECGRLLRR